MGAFMLATSRPFRPLPRGRCPRPPGGWSSALASTGVPRPLFSAVAHWHASSIDGPGTAGVAGGAGQRAVGAARAMARSAVLVRRRLVVLELEGPEERVVPDLDGHPAQILLPVEQREFR